jgi:hypothetical protein
MSHDSQDDKIEINHMNIKKEVLPKKEHRPISRRRSRKNKVRCYMVLADVQYSSLIGRKFELLEQI